MKARKSKDIQKTLAKKGFSLSGEKDHHQYYYLYYKGKKQRIFTYFSHGKKEYDKFLMNQIKKQLKFTDSETADLFFDCPLKYEDYITHLQNQGIIID